MEEKIMEIIESDSLMKQIYEDNEGCFRNIIASTLIKCNEDDVLKIAINMLAVQCKLYDILLNNIAVLGSKELIEKSHNDMNNIFNNE